MAGDEELLRRRPVVVAPSDRRRGDVDAGQDLEAGGVGDAQVALGIDVVDPGAGGLDMVEHVDAGDLDVGAQRGYRCPTAAGARGSAELLRRGRSRGTGVPVALAAEGACQRDL